MNYRYNRLYQEASILPVGEKVNPLKPEGYWLHEPEMVAYFMARNGKPTREVWTSHGSLGDTWAVGTKHTARADQSCRDRGTWTVLGVVEWTATGARLVAGECPSRKITHGVFK